MKIVITTNEIVDRKMWVDVCKLLGMNTIDLEPDEEITLTPEQAVALGLIEEGERW